MNWQTVAEQQALLLEELASLYRKALQELSQYKNIEDEEKRLNSLISKGGIDYE